MDVFKSDGYPENFINNHFKTFLDNKNRIQEKVPQKPLFLVLPCFGPVSLQTTIKLRKSLKGVLNFRKWQIVFKSQNKLANAFRFEDSIPKELTSGVVYKSQSGICNKSYYGKRVRHINVKIGEHIRILPWLKRKLSLGSCCYWSLVTLLFIHDLSKVLVC